MFSYTVRASALEEMPSDHMKLFTHGSYRTRSSKAWGCSYPCIRKVTAIDLGLYGFVVTVST